jgi:DNA repair exonuclease SbcCD ATPase subunit
VAAQQAATRLQEARVEHLDASRAVAELEGRLTAEAAAKRSSTAACADVEARCAARNLPADTASLQRLAAVAEQVSEQRTTYLRWSRTHEAYAGDVAHATERLQSQLAARGEPLDPSVSVEAALAAYTAACADRAEQAAAASRRPALTQALADRLTAEDAAVAATAALKRAITGLRSATRAAGAPVAEDAPETDVVAALEQWQVTYADRVATADAHQHDWAELQAALDGATLADLELELRRLRDDNAELAEVAARAEAAATAALERAQSAAAAAGVDPLSGSDVDSATKLVSDARQDLASARTEALGLSGFAENSGGVAAERARALRSVPEAEEAVAAARAELDRVTELASTLAMTQQFLTAAQERVHRDIAPVLADTLRAWLPAVTGGRYVDATVNPATLEVKVCGPRRNWREADRLSIGTAEQVYLLLRVALAQHLTTTGEKCPLLLDDVTVQADDDRTREVLDLLLRLSADRQVVLFAQEPIVAEWAQEHLDGYAEHSMVELSQIDVG